MNFVAYLLKIVGNAKLPSILSQMIQEAHEIRENQSYRNVSSAANIAGVRQNITEESVSFERHLLSCPRVYPGAIFV